MNKNDSENFIQEHGLTEAIEYFLSYSKEHGMLKTSKDLGIPGKDLLLILSNPTSKEAKMKLAGLFGLRYNHITGTLY